MEPIRPDGGALKRLPVTPCYPDPQAAHVSIFFPSLDLQAYHRLCEQSMHAALASQT